MERFLDLGDLAVRNLNDQVAVRRRFMAMGDYKHSHAGRERVNRLHVKSRTIIMQPIAIRAMVGTVSKSSAAITTMLLAALIISVSGTIM